VQPLETVYMFPDVLKATDLVAIWFSGSYCNSLVNPN
jgi:hypothetical protein